jgi:hypothetical protein
LILDPDEPLPTRRTERQSLIRTERGWAVLGQPTSKAQSWLAEAREELAELVPNMAEDSRLRAASIMAAELLDRRAL